jgi:hypothetical protein
MTEKRKSESIIQPDLRSYSPVSCKDFGKLSDKEKAKIVEVIH